MKIKYKGRTRLYNDLLFLGAYIEYISRATKNEQLKVIDTIGYDNLKHIFLYADVNHCLSMEQHLIEFKENYTLSNGTYDTSELVKGLLIESPSVAQSMFARMIELMGIKYEDAFDKWWELHHSWIAKYLLDFNDIVYFQPTYALVECYKKGYIDYDSLPVGF